MPNKSDKQGKAIKVLAWGQDVQKNKRNTQKQAFEFFSNEKRPCNFLQGL